MNNLRIFKTLESYLNNYGRTLPYKFLIGYDEAIEEHRLQSEMNDNKIRISTKIGWMEWIPVIDCDSLSRLKDSCRYLAERHHRFIVYKSSKSGYWVLVDNVSSFGSCIKFMNSVFRQDFKYVSNCEYFREITIRGFKKDIVPKRIFSQGELSESLKRFSARVDIWFKTIYPGEN